MAEGGYHKYDLRYFADSQFFRDYDKKRFFQFGHFDSLTTVAISKVQLTGTKKDKTEDTRDVTVLTRSSKKDGHAEKQTVGKIRQIIEELEASGTKIKTLTLVMNITYSPCNDANNNCQNVLQQFFASLSCKTTFVLRFAYLYHEKGVTGDKQPIEQLANWMIGLEGVCGMKVESIEVSKELSSYSHRDQTKWEEVKKKREKEDRDMKEKIKQVYTRKREIEEENRTRDEAAAASLQTCNIEDRVVVFQ